MTKTVEGKIISRNPFTDRRISDDGVYSILIPNCWEDITIYFDSYIETSEFKECDVISFNEYSGPIIHLGHIMFTSEKEYAHSVTFRMYAQPV